MPSSHIRLLLFALYFCLVAHETSAQSVRLDTPTMYHLLDFQNRQTDKQLLLLEQNRDFCPSLKLGTQFRASALAATTNAADSFPYLGRFPTDFVGTSATDARVIHANFGAIANATPWLTAHVDLLYSDVFTFPTFEQGSFQVRQAYAVIGDADVTPFYGFIGKKNVSFGDFGTLSPFSQAVPWHYFAPIVEGAGLGYYDGNFSFVATAINGGRGIRVADSEEIGKLNNFALNTSYEWRGEESGLRFGAGYLNGTIYNADVAEHINADLFAPDVAAWDVNASVKYKRLAVTGEFVQTTDAWPVVDARVSAYAVEAGLDMQWGRFPGWLSASWSEGLQGPEGSEFEFNRQLVIGGAAELSANTLLTIEYVESTGFAPLIDITTVSNRDVRQQSVVVGLVFVL